MTTEHTTFPDEAWKGFDTRLRRYVRRRVDPANVDDIVGDIMLRLVLHREELAAARNPAAWMFRVAANVVADHYRSRDKEQRARSEAATMAEEPAGDEAEASAAAEIADCLIPFIRSLPDPYSEALLLTDIEGVSQVDAAKRLGLSPSGMKSRIQRGRRKLKDALLRCCTFQVDVRGGIIDYRRRTACCGVAD